MKTAVLLPCHNEGAAIHAVVQAFRAALPEADIYVYDNLSTDDTAEQASRAGAIVRAELRKGKGWVVRRMFADIEADIYVLADGDGTYDAASATALVKKLLEGPLDMVVGARVHQAQSAYRPGHVLGNRALTGMVELIFGSGFTDMLSGYRVFSRRFVKSFPSLSSGFEIETELTVHALQTGLPCGEIETPYAERAQGTHSKLSTWRDGFRILKFIVLLFKEVKPLLFFGAAGAALAALSVLLAVPVFEEFWETGLVSRLPTAVLCTGIMIVALMSISCGIILDSVSRGRLETKRLHYLMLQGPERQ